MAKRKSKSRKQIRVTSEEMRLYVSAVALLLFAGVILLRLIYIQAIDRSRYQDVANSQYIIKIPKEAQRGLIYDRNMNVLALNEPCVSIGLDKSRMQGNARSYARSLAPILGKSASWLRKRIDGVSGNFVWLARRIHSRTGTRIARLNMSGVRVEKDTRRIYPHHNIGSHLLGFTDADNRGIEGVELQFEKQLAGKSGWATILRDGRGRAVPENIVESVTPFAGKSIVLTIDHILQTIVTEELLAAAKKYKAHNATVIVTNPGTGELLAMANYPDYDPNRPGRFAPATRRNRALTDAFEPGSTFKVVPFAALLKHHIHPIEAPIFCENGRYSNKGRVIRDTKPHSWLNVGSVLAVSSNIGTVKLANEVGSQRLYDMARALGIGERTGIQLPGENVGICKEPADWSAFTQASFSIGQEVSVNALQMAMAYGAVANGGTLLKPRIVSEILSEDGGRKRFTKAEVVRRAVPEAISDTLRSLLIDVVEHGTGKAASINGVQVGGKTGTAQKPRRDGKGYHTNEFVASFVGFLPAESPKYLILVKMEVDRTHQWGGATAAPTFQKIAHRIRVYDREVKTDYTREDSATPAAVESDPNRVVLPDFSERRMEFALAALQDLGLKIKTTGEGGFVRAQLPEAGKKVYRGETIELELFAPAIEDDGYITMPALTGLSLREALHKLALMNMEPVVYGNGKVVSQKPAPGTQVKSGIRCIIECQAPGVNVPFLAGLR